MNTASLYHSQLSFFVTGQTRPEEFRIQQCETLKRAVLEYEPQILAALSKDMRRPERSLPQRSDDDYKRD